jgi:hypothetical protein
MVRSGGPGSEGYDLSGGSLVLPLPVAAVLCTQHVGRVRDHGRCGIDPPLGAEVRPGD